MKFRKIRQLAAVAALACASTGAMATCSSEPYIGSICYTAANFCPNGYFAANGGVQSIPQYSALFSLLGTNFGGNGTSTFGLPDLRGRAPVAAGQGPGLTNVVLGQSRGAEGVNLALSNLPPAPPATVSIAVNTVAGSQTSPANGNTYLGASGAGPGAATVWSNASGSPVNLSGVTVTGGASGQGLPVNTLSPQLGLTACIAWSGLYPSRP
jgi:microcystin-dependent protein